MGGGVIDGEQQGRQAPAPDPVGAMKRFLAAIEADPQDAEAWLGQGEALAALGEIEGARQALERAVSLDPTLWQARERLARLTPAPVQRHAPRPGWRPPPRPSTPQGPRSVAAMLDRLAAQEGWALARDRASGEPEWVTGRALAARAAQWACRLAGGVAPVPVLGRTHLDAWAAWLGALGAGRPPTFLSYPSSKIRGAHFAEKLANYRRHFGCTEIVGTPEDAAWCADLVTAAELPPPPAAPGWALPAPDAPLFLQCSSGTTGLQKAVPITTGRLEHQLEAYGRALALDPGRDVIVSWLPLYHDMGLVATFLLPLYWDVPVVYLDPFEWAADPGRLYKVIEAVGGTLVWQPNFAYAFACRHPVRADLSRVRGFVNCAEPISADVQERFCAALGVDPAQLVSCYALAENTFCATQTPLGEPATVRAFDAQALGQHWVVPGGEQRLVSVGRPLEGVELHIERTAGEDVGEIWLRGPSAMRAYLDRPPPRADRWIPTGDLGFVLDGELYVTGRRRDLLVVQGKNLHPHDLEQVAHDVPGVQPGRVVAVGQPDPEAGTERVWILLEPTSQAAPAHREVAAAVASALEPRFEVRVQALGVPRGWLRKTSSGKLARADNLRRLEAERARHVHVIGDSHVQVLWRGPGAPEDHYAHVHAHWIGPVWAGSWDRVFPLVARVAARVRPCDVLVLAVGEQECRTIFGSAADPEAQIAAAIAGHRAALERLQALHPGPVAYMTGIGTQSHDDGQMGKPWRVTGALEDRLAWQARFYEGMREVCADLQIGFVDACTPTQGADGQLRTELLRDGVHLAYAHRERVVDWMRDVLGVIAEDPAPPAPLPAWDGSRAAFDALCKAEIERLAGRPLLPGEEARIVTGEVLDSLALTELVIFVQVQFRRTPALHRITRADLESLDVIWARLVAA